MRAVAPGKLLLTGAYAVLDGAPALVAAIDRYAVADAARPAVGRSPELVAAIGDGPAPHVDVRALNDPTGRKLGLGSSAAALVAALGARALARGEDLASSVVRSRIFRDAREAHARAQGGGSGVDVAASVHGGVLRYVVAEDGGVSVRALECPRRLVLGAYDSGTSARTSDMLARVRSFRRAAAAPPLFEALSRAAADACTSFEQDDAEEFTRRASAFGHALAALGRAAETEIVPPAFAELGALAEREGATFIPSGAGGGDVAVWLGTSPPSARFSSRAEALFMRPLSLDVDRGGLRSESTSSSTGDRLSRSAPDL